jgi:crotonobetainyl-CoA:carnitine CoA-transferase CaiB-like acyl-CoA transferase
MRHENGPLTGIRVLELGTSVAGPFCGRLLADFGAEVVKVEDPRGDPLRTMSKRIDGESLYATTLLRNKRLAAVDLHSDEGRKLVREMARHCDILIENFRPGVLEQWGLGYEELSRDNPGIILVRISGFGQTGPYRERAGYGVIGEAMSGLRYLTGDPDRPPGRTNASVTDEVTALYAALGAMMALHERATSGRGQIIDAALYESAFSLIEPHVPVFGALGIVPERAGSRLPDSTPNNLYPTRDQRHIHITAMADGVFRRLVDTMGQSALADDPRFHTAEARSANADEIDCLISAWTETHDLLTLERTLEDAGVPASRIYDIADIYADPHYHARKMLVDLPHRKFGKVTVPGVVPKLSETPGTLRHAGGAIGEDTRDVLTNWCNLVGDAIDALEARGVVALAADAPTPA